MPDSFGANLSIGTTHCIQKKNSTLSKKEIAHGVLNDRSSSSILSHLILIGKYFVYSNAQEENIQFQFADCNNSFHEKLRVEKYISVMTNSQTAFVKKME